MIFMRRFPIDVIVVILLLALGFFHTLGEVQAVLTRREEGVQQ
jgi:hypothetical protein